VWGVQCSTRCIQQFVCTHTHTRTHTYDHTHTRTHACLHALSLTHARVHTHTARAHTHKCTRALKPTLFTHARTRARTRARTHAHVSHAHVYHFNPITMHLEPILRHQQTHHHARTRTHTQPLLRHKQMPNDRSTDCYTVCSLEIMSVHRCAYAYERTYISQAIDPRTQVRLVLLRQRRQVRANRGNILHLRLRRLLPAVINGTARLRRGADR